MAIDPETKLKIAIAARQSGKTELTNYDFQEELDKVAIRSWLKNKGMSNLLYTMIEVVKEYENPEEYLVNLCNNLEKTLEIYSKRNEGEE